MISWFKSLQPKEWLQLISIVVSVIAIFLSNFLGRLDAQRKAKRQWKEERYIKLYVPFIKFFFKHRPHEWQFFFLLAEGSYDELDTLISNNLQYLDKESTTVFFHLENDELEFVKSSANEAVSKIRNHNFKVGEPIVIFSDRELSAYNSFNDFVLSVLKESANLAEELGLEPIGQSLYDIYSSEICRPKSHTSKEQ